MVRTRSKSGSTTLESNPSKIGREPSAKIQTPKTPHTSTTAIVPSTLKSVLLYDWWLVKVDDGGRKGLAVGGFASRERAGERIFYSAAISKRHEATILEATDGIIITVSGLINRSRTCENGFPSMVYSHFLLGFPFNWQDYVESVVPGVKANASYSDHNSASMDIEPDLDDLEVTRLIDLVLSSCEESSRRSNLTTSVESALNETPIGHRKVNSCQDNEEHDVQDHQRNDFIKNPLCSVEEAKPKMDVDFQVPSRRVFTRSMTRSENSHKRQFEENNSCENSGRISNVISSTNKNSTSDKSEAEGRRSSLRLRNRKQK